MTNLASLPLEDELGDVLEKALRRLNLTADAVADSSGVAIGRIRDAIDYRSELTCAELRRLAAALRLNEVGLCALGTGRYPSPALPELPFEVWPLRMRHGIGVANAYLVANRASRRALLFDTGAGIHALEAAWPAEVEQLDAVFLTHVEAEHAGGLCEVVARFGVSSAFVPEGATAACGVPIGESAQRTFGGLTVTAYSTPGHVAAHNCYAVRRSDRVGTALLISGDLFFAGSVGGAYFSAEKLQTSLRKMLAAMPPCTVVAPGHGPLTTVENELKYNPFVL